MVAGAFARPAVSPFAVRRSGLQRRREPPPGQQRIQISIGSGGRGARLTYKLCHGHAAMDLLRRIASGPSPRPSERVITSMRKPFGIRLTQEQIDEPLRPRMARLPEQC